ncbi:MAG: hypothetical protein RR472_05305 [Anaerovoracaceae bacterium]
MREKVLLTAVGSTDPVRGYHDGPMLHILRNYRPQKVYIILTKKMEELEAEDKRFSAAIKNFDLAVEVEFIYSAIENPAEFNAFDCFEQYMDKVKKENPSSEILINLTSGTPQMILKLALLSESVKYNALPIQVMNPAKDANTDPTAIQDYAGEDSLELNVDNEKKENRCQLAKMIVLRRAFFREQLKSLVTNYNYTGAMGLVKAQGLSDEEVAVKLIQHLKERQELTPTTKIEKAFPEFNFFPIKDQECKQMVEYFLMMRNLAESDKFAELLLRLNPFTVALQIELLKKKLNLALEEITCTRGERIKFSRKKMQERDPEMLRVLEVEYGIYVEDKDLSVMVLNRIIQMKVREYGGMEKIKGTFTLLEEINGKRNEVAHTLKGISKEEFTKMAGVSSGTLLEDICGIIKYIYGNKFKKEHLQIYEEVNQLILETLR